MNELNMGKEKRNVQQFLDNPRFPLIEQILQTSEVDEIIKEMTALRGLMEKSRSPFCDPDLSLRMETAGVGLLETVRLLEKLKELSGRCKAQVF
ncbi:MAG: hypothetical protein WBM02_01770 [bacterium]